MALVATLIGLLESLIRLYIIIILVAVVVSWLAAFNVINPHNNFVRAVLRVLIALTEPVFRSIRAVVPAVGNMDFSPIIVWLVLVVLLSFLHRQFGDLEIF